MACKIIYLAEYKANHPHGGPDVPSVAFSGGFDLSPAFALMPYSALIAMMNIGTAMLTVAKPKESEHE